MQWIQPAIDANVARQNEEIRQERQDEERQLMAQTILDDHPEYLLSPIDMNTTTLADFIVRYPLDTDVDTVGVRGICADFFNNRYGVLDYIIAVGEYRGAEVRDLLEEELRCRFTNYIYNLPPHELARRAAEIVDNRSHNMLWTWPENE